MPKRIIVPPEQCIILQIRKNRAPLLIKWDAINIKMETTEALLFLLLERNGERSKNVLLFIQVVFLHDIEVVVEFINQRCARGNLHIDDLFIGDMLEILDE